MNTHISSQKTLLFNIYLHTNKYFNYKLFLIIYLLTQSSYSQDQLLPPPNNIPETISIQQAVTLSLIHNIDHKLAINTKNHTKAQKIAIIAELIPKLRGSMRYTRNVPEIKSNLSSSNPSQAFLYRKVAQLLSNSGDQEGAEQLNSSADQLQRRPISGEIITKPKHAVDGQLTLEIPIFNGPNFARYLQINESIALQNAKVLESQAQRIYDSASAYFEALYQQDLLEQVKIQTKTSQEHYQQISDQFQLGLLSNREKLRSEHIFIQNKFRETQARLELRKTIGRLGSMIGKKEEFGLVNIPDINTQILNNSNEELFGLALSQRSDLRAQKKAVHTAGRERLGSILQFLPTITFNTDANYTSNTEGLTSEALTFAFSLNASYTFFNGGSRFGLLKESSIKRQREQIRLDYLTQNITKQIRAHKAKLKLLNQDLKNKILALKLNQEILDNTKNKYSMGLENLKNFLESQQELFDKQIAVKKTEFDIKKEKLAFLNSLGVLSAQVFSAN